MSKWIKPYVYVIGPANRGPVKSGISDSPEIRLSQLQTGYHETLCILAMFPGGGEDEQALHKLFALNACSRAARSHKPFCAARRRKPRTVCRCYRSCYSTLWRRW
jgi:hypothetical protein